MSPHIYFSFQDPRSCHGCAHLPRILPTAYVYTKVCNKKRVLCCCYKIFPELIRIKEVRIVSIIILSSKRTYQPVRRAHHLKCLINTCVFRTRPLNKVRLSFCLARKSQLIETTLRNENQKNIMVKNILKIRILCYFFIEIMKLTFSKNIKWSLLLLK